MVNGGSTLTGFIRELEYLGIFDVVIPFILLFTVVFAVLQRTKLFGSDKKNINIVVAFVMATLTVVPHITGNYPGQYDPVLIINALLPSVSVLMIAIILLLILVGMFAGEWGAAKASGVVFVIALIFIGYIFGTTVGWWSSPSEVFGGWWGSTLTTLVIVILVIGGLLWFISGESKTAGEKIGSFVKDLFKGPKS